MSIANRVLHHIAQHDLYWEPVLHGASRSSMEAAHLAHVRPDRFAKAVVLEDDGGYVMAVIPADYRLDLDGLNAFMGRELTLASERELGQLFSDCSPGAVPPLGEAYGVPTVWDDGLGYVPDVFFEGGDHRTLVHMNGAAFAELMRSAHPLSHTL